MTKCKISRYFAWGVCSESTECSIMFDVRKLKKCDLKHTTPPPLTPENAVNFSSTSPESESKSITSNVASTFISLNTLDTFIPEKHVLCNNAMKLYLLMEFVFLS